MADWDTSNPEDSGIVSQYPANARAARSAVVTNFGVDHHEANDADVGKHEVIQMTQEATPTIASGEVGLWNDSGVLKTRTGAGAATRLEAFPAGTVMVFYQASPPPGWGTHSAGLEDRTLMVVSHASGDGGTTSGSWTISGFTVAGTAISIAQLPAHNHSGSTADADGNHNHGGNTGSAGSHDHGGNTGSAGDHRHNVEVYSDTAGGGFRVAVGRETGFVGTVSGSNAMSASGNHNHSISSVSNHNHSVSNSGTHTHSLSISSVGSGNTHTHGISHNGNWRPSANNVILAEKS